MSSPSFFTSVKVAATAATVVLAMAMLSQFVVALVTGRSLDVWGLLQVSPVDDGTVVSVGLGLDLVATLSLWSVLVLAFGVAAVLLVRRARLSGAGSPSAT
jgi:hypothetical protein